MVESTAFRLVIRTPHEVILRAWVRSARVLTETGHVGLRPRSESTVLAVEPGVVNAQPVEEEPNREIFVGTAGGMLMCDRDTATLLTPLAVVGDTETHIVEKLDDLMQRPNSEMEARATFSKLEGHILTELRREQTQAVKPRFE